MANAKRLRLIVGLDYGTTFSGMSYVASNATSAADIQIVSDWPNYTHAAWKAPSAIAYASENSRLSADRWGFVPSGVHRYTWTKLLLDKDTRPSEHDDPLLRTVFGAGLLLLPPGKSAEEVCKDYLRGLYRYLVSILERRLGKAIFDATPIECWMTVPALWSDKATALTKQAAVSAGFGSRSNDRVYMIKEPEAAALTALKPLLDTGSLRPLKNEDIMICDCGGGTVDLATYRVTAREPKLEFKELCVGIGGKCGSTYIDRNFIVWMKINFHEAYVSQPANKRGPGSKFMDSFEIAKRSFGSPDAQDDPIEIENLQMDTPNSELYDADEGRVLLPRDEMASFFKPVVGQIIRLIEAQVKTGKKSGYGKLSVSDLYQNTEGLGGVNLETTFAIGPNVRMLMPGNWLGWWGQHLILVGGFGDSAYLNCELRQWCAANGQIELTCPPQCQAAIVRGAALRGLEGTRPTSRRMRRHYGFDYGRLFRDTNPITKRYWYPWTEAYYCRDVMDWKIAKGQQIDDNAEMTQVLGITFFEDTIPRTDVELYTCNHDEAPVYSDHDSAENVGVIDITFTNKDIADAEKRWDARRASYMRRFSYTIVMKFLDGEIQVKVVVDGEERGSARINYI